MADLRLEHIYKVYPNGTKAVSDFTMDIKDKEFIVFVGPSGCGKSTTLRMIAGLEDISAGELYIGNRIVNDVEPKDRDIAMVFQNYALYPHMTVYENMAFGLELRHVPNDIIHEKVLWAAKILGLTEYLDRKPKAMSGGQRQRVSLGRAILRNPKVMLLDEPLSNLDAKLRAQMRSEIAKLHEDLKTTFIYVTHDQVEAMTLGTRVVVMKLGRIQQIDTPKNLYSYPINKFVAGFIGTPQMNFFEGTLKKVGDKINVSLAYSDSSVSVPQNDFIKVQPQYYDGKHQVYIGLRCEDISVDPEVVKKSKSLVDVRISHFEELGNETLIYGDINMKGDGFAETSTRVIIKGSSTYDFKIGSVVKAAFDMKKCHLFDKNTEETIMPRLPKVNVIDCEIKDGKINFEGQSVVLPKFMNIKNAKGELYLNNDAIILGEGPCSGEVINFEIINDKKLIYILVGERVIFALVDKEYKIGAKINFDLDYTQINVKNGDKEIIKALPEYDNIDATFINFASLKNKTGKYDKSIENRKSVVKKNYDEQVKKLTDKYNKDLEEAKRTDIAALKANDSKKLAEIKSENAAKIKELKTTYKTKKATADAIYKENSKKIKKDVIELYKGIKENEYAAYKMFKSINTDREAARKHHDEFKNFKENFPKERENEYIRRMNDETLRYETEINSLSGQFKRDKLSLTNDYKKMKKDFHRDENLPKYLEKEYKSNLANLKRELNVNLNKASQLFFFKFNDFIIQSSDVISNKTIQGLGTKVFIKDYLLEVPHSAFIEDKDGFEVTIKDTLDYNSKKYLVCTFFDDGNEKTLYVLSKKDKKVGEKIKLSFDINQIHVTEKSLGLKIY